MTSEEDAMMRQRREDTFCAECKLPYPILVTHPISGLRICATCARRTVPAGYIPKEYAEVLWKMWDEAFVQPEAIVNTEPKKCAVYWQAEAGVIQETEPVLTVSEEPLDRENLDKRWLEEMKKAPPPTSAGKDAIMDLLGEIKLEWFPHIRLSKDLIVVRATGNCVAGLRLGVWEKFSVYWTVTRERFLREAIWAESVTQSEG